MNELNSGQRQYLKRQAHSLKPVVQIGKLGLTENVIQSIDNALDAHELIKVKFGDFQDQKRELSAELTAATASELVNTVGNIITLYRRHRDADKRVIVLPD
ncbi:MAG TPA: ribosome assembly RNA-binding protein YhbY [Herpetosiphonaceae bacterium]